MKFCYALIDPVTGNVEKEYCSSDSILPLQTLMLYHRVHKTQHTFFRVRQVDTMNTVVDERTEYMPERCNYMPERFNIEYSQYNYTYAILYRHLIHANKKSHSINTTAVTTIYTECVRMNVSAEITELFNSPKQIDFDWCVKFVQAYKTCDTFCSIILNYLFEQGLMT